MKKQKPFIEIDKNLDFEGFKTNCLEYMRQKSYIHLNEEKFEVKIICDCGQEYKIRTEKDYIHTVCTCGREILTFK